MLKRHDRATLRTPLKCRLGETVLEYPAGTNVRVIEACGSKEQPRLGAPFGPSYLVEVCGERRVKVWLRADRL